MTQSPRVPLGYLPFHWHPFDLRALFDNLKYQCSTTPKSRVILAT
jgi:hypothetical protein